jgi:hypothetical protein
MAELIDPGKVGPPAEPAYAERRLAQAATALAALPRGCLVRKTIKGRPYYYLAYREGARVRFKYLGKLTPEEADRYAAEGKIRAGLKREMTRLRGRIAVLKRRQGNNPRGPGAGKAGPATRNELDRNLL